MEYHGRFAIAGGQNTNNGLQFGVNTGNIYMGGAPPNPDEQFLEALIDGDTNTEAGITPPEPGTCEWILSESKFTDWKMGQENYPLWIHGYGGCGKSTLCSFLIKEQQKWAFPPGEVVNGTKGAKKTIVAGCFCPKRQTPEWILRVLLYEILKQNRGLIDKSSPDFWQASSDNGNEHPILNSDAFDSAELLAKLLGGIAKHPDVAKLYLVIDGQYDHPRDARSIQNIIELVSRHCTDSPPPRWIVSTRPNGFDMLTGHQNVFAINLFLQNRDDITKVARSRMGIIQKIHTSIQDDFRDEVVEILTRRSEGMFLWLSLALNSLEDSAIWDINAIKERLQSIPFDVQAIYGKLFEAADPKMRTLLGWVFLAGRPLKIDEALTIFALENKPKSVKDMKKNIMSPVSLRGSIGGPMKAFLTLQEDDTICAAHPSVKEFIDDILNNQQQQSQKLVTGIVRVGVHKQMAAACVAYLNLEEVQALSVPKPPVDNNGMIDKKKLEKEVEKYLEKYQFLDYSIRYLGLHLRESGKDEIKDSAQGIDNLFDKNSSALRNWVQGYDLLVRCTQGKYTGSSSGLSTLFIAARLNLTSLAEHSISSSGLQTALASGFSLPGLKSLAGGIASVSMVREQMLNLPDLKGWCALHVAADSEAEEVLCWLLEKGASVDSITKGFIRPGRTALHFASSKPSDVGSRMVEALIKKGANVRQPTTLGGNTPLHYAVQSGSVDTVKLLLRKPASKSLGADPNAANYSGITALHKAVAIPGLEEIVETLLGNNTTDPEKTTAIDKVGFAREVKSAKLTTVLKTVATSNPTSMLKAATDAVRGVAMNQSALHIAVGCKGTEETTKKLLDWYHRNEQKPTSKDSMGYTALHSAASGVGCATHLKLLIDSKKLDVNALDNNGGTPLILYMKNVSQRRKELGELEPLKEALDMLLSAGADTRIKDKDGKTAMDFAELAGLEWAVQRLKTAAGIPTTPDSSSPVESPVSSPKKPKTGRFGFRFG